MKKENERKDSAMHIPIVSRVCKSLKDWFHKENLKRRLADECYELRIDDCFGHVENFDEALVVLRSKYADLGLSESEIHVGVTSGMNRNIPLEI